MRHVIGAIGWCRRVGDLRSVLGGAIGDVGLLVSGRVLPGGGRSGHVDGVLIRLSLGLLRGLALCLTLCLTLGLALCLTLGLALCLTLCLTLCLALCLTLGLPLRLTLGLPRGLAFFGRRGLLPGLLDRAGGWLQRVIGAIGWRGWVSDFRSVLFRSVLGGAIGRSGRRVPGGVSGVLIRLSHGLLPGLLDRAGE